MRTPSPRRMLSTLDCALPAWSVAVIVIPLAPASMSMTTLKLPFGSAVVDAVALFASLCAPTWLPPSVMPTIVATDPLTTDPSAGEVIETPGGTVSRMYVTLGDGSPVPPGPTSRTVNSFAPGVSPMAGNENAGVSGTAISWIGAASSPARARYSRSEYSVRPTTAGETLPARSTVGWFVNDVVGPSRSGVVAGRDGTAVGLGLRIELIHHPGDGIADAGDDAAKPTGRRVEHDTTEPDDGDREHELGDERQSAGGVGRASGGRCGPSRPVEAGA